MQYNTEHIGQMIRDTRKAMGVTQKDLALTSGTGLRFIIELEKGKPTCQWGKVLHVLHTLGIKIDFHSPVALDLFSGNGAGKGSGAGNSDGSGWG